MRNKQTVKQSANTAVFSSIHLEVYLLEQRVENELDLGLESILCSWDHHPGAGMACRLSTELRRGRWQMSEKPHLAGTKEVTPGALGSSSSSEHPLVVITETQIMENLTAVPLDSDLACL